MNNDNVFAALAWCLGVVIGGAVISIVWVSKINEIKAPIDAAIAKCEAELPRDQVCYIEYVARVKPK